jgi:phenylpropionate dioxygenase-like ring-hydroxylating dioxygenase large terminal subunit
VWRTILLHAGVRSFGQYFAPMAVNKSNIESVLWDDWQPAVELARLRQVGRVETTVLGVPLSVEVDVRKGAVMAFVDSEPVAALEIRYGLVWICLGRPAHPIVEFADYADTDRIAGTSGSVAVATSGLRVVENFLDLGHFAFVHTGYLGEEPHTEIHPYSVQLLPEGGILATGCKIYQPKSSPVDQQGFDVDYVYAVLRPYIAVLYKANAVERHRKDLVALCVQPVSEEACIATLVTSFLPHGTDPHEVRRFQQLIFGQDRPILENQLPRRLPLSPTAEVSVRSDGSSGAYRRWLTTAGVRFGAIAA